MASASGRQQVADLGVELATAELPHQPLDRGDTAHPVRDLDVFGRLGIRAAIGIASPPRRPGQPRPSHLSYEATRARSTSSG